MRNSIDHVFILSLISRFTSLASLTPHLILYLSIGFHQISWPFLLAVLKVTSKLHSVPHDDLPSTVLLTLMELSFIVITIVLDETPIAMSPPIVPIALIELALLQI